MGPLRTFIPRETFGAGIDGHDHGDTAQILTPHKIARMRQVGFDSLSYRLRTASLLRWSRRRRAAWKLRMSIALPSRVENLLDWAS